MIFPNQGKGEPIEITKELKKIKNGEPAKSAQQKILRASIMGYELGDLQRYSVYSARPGMPAQHLAGHKENAKLALADLVIQARMFCLDEGWDFDQIQAMGLKHLQERMIEIKKEGFAEVA